MKSKGRQTHKWCDQHFCEGRGYIWFFFFFFFVSLLFIIVAETEAALNTYFKLINKKRNESILG